MRGLLLALVPLLALPAAAAEPDSGPLRLGDTFLLGTGFLALEPESAAVLAPGSWRADLVVSGNNTWSQSLAVDWALRQRPGRARLSLDQLRALEPGVYDGDGIFFVDGELRRAALTVRRGFAGRVEVAVGLTALDFSGGFTDSLVQGFHDAFSLDQNGRTRVPRDLFTLYLRDEDGRELYRDTAPGSGLADLTLTVKTVLPAPAREWTLALAGEVKLPVGSSGLFGSGATDLGVKLLGGRTIGRTALHLTAGVVRLGPAELLGTPAQTRFFGAVAAERPLGRGFAALFQVRGRQSPLHDLGIAQLAEPSYLVDLGVRIPVRGRTDLWVAVSENFLNFGTSADVALHLGLSRPF